VRRKKVRFKKALQADNYVSVLLSDCPYYVQHELERLWGWEDMLKLSTIPLSWAIEYLKGGNVYQISVKIDGYPKFNYSYDDNPRDCWELYLKVIVDSIMTSRTKEEIEPYKKVEINVFKEEVNVFSQTLCLTPDFKFKVWGNTK